MENNTKVINIKNILMILVIMISIISLGTFAWLSYRSNDTAMVLKIGEIDGMSVTLKPYQINSSLNPVTTYDSGIVIDVTANNKKTSEDNFKLFYKIDSIDSELVNSAFKYTVTKSTDNGSTYTIVKEGDFSTASSNSELEIYKESVPGNNTTYLYKVYLWIDGNMGDQSSMQGKVFTGELRAKVSYPVSPWGEEPVIDNIASTYVTYQNGVQFGGISSDTNGKGLYLRAGTENDAHPIMYFRGAVTNNNVLFGGFCWKIVRTTNTGGTKLIYNGTPVNGECTNTTGTATQLAETKAFNSNSDSPADVGYMYGTRYTVTSRSSSNLVTSYKYGNGVSWNGSNYILTNTLDSTGTWATDYNTLNNNHYTCFNDTGTCTSVYYIYYTDTSVAYYITLTNGKTVENAIDEMLTSSSNTTSSVIKTALDAWYEANLSTYENYLEDTVWCNDRSISSLGGWNPNGGNTFNGSEYYIKYGAYERAWVTHNPIVTCPSVNDSFTTSSSNGNGKLNHSIGLLTMDEIMMAGGTGGTTNRTYYLYTNQNNWFISPNAVYGTFVDGFTMHPVGSLFVVNMATVIGVRPSISLKSGLTFVGSGTSSDPYVIQKYVYAGNLSSVEIGEPLPNNNTYYETPEEAMESLKIAGGGTKDYHFFLRYTVRNNVVTESYVGFVVTPTMASANTGMTSGTYYLRGGNNGDSFEENKAILQSAFGSANCSGAYTFVCEISGLRVDANEDDEVSASDTSISNCYTDIDGISGCTV